MGAHNWGEGLVGTTTVTRVVMDRATGERKNDDGNDYATNEEC